MLGVIRTAYRPPFVTAWGKYEADPFCRGGVGGLLVVLALNVGRARARCQVSTAEPGPRGGAFAATER